VRSFPAHSRAHICRSTVRSCEPTHASGLTPQFGSRNVSRRCPSGEAAGEGVSVNRRFVAALMLLVCLSGIIQPALSCVPPSDCCSSGCDTPSQPSSGWVEVSRCCATQAPAATRLSIAPQSRQTLNVTGSSPALITLADDPLRLVLAPESREARAAITSGADQSRTYLRTARLRL